MCATLRILINLPFDTFLLTIILQGMIVSQKYCATSMLIKEIPIDVKKIIGGVIDCKNINFLIEGLGITLN